MASAGERRQSPPRPLAVHGRPVGVARADQLTSRDEVAERNDRRVVGPLHGTTVQVSEVVSPGLSVCGRRPHAHVVVHTYVPLSGLVFAGRRTHVESVVGVFLWRRVPREQRHEPDVVASGQRHPRLGGDDAQADTQPEERVELADRVRTLVTRPHPQLVVS